MNLTSIGCIHLGALQISLKKTGREFEREFWSLHIWLLEYYFLELHIYTHYVYTLISGETDLITIQEPKVI